MTSEQHGEAYEQPQEEKTTCLGDRNSFMLFSEEGEMNYPEQGLLTTLRTPT